MIFVDGLVPRRMPWRGKRGLVCHMISDTSEEELDLFAAKIGLPAEWKQSQRHTIPHYDLSPGWRSRARWAGAQEASLHKVVAAMKRFREGLLRTDSRRSSTSRT